MKEITDFNSEILSRRGISLVLVCSAGCGPCVSLEFILDSMAGKYRNVKFGKVYTDSDRSLTGRYGIFSTPTTMIFVDGKPMQSLVGLKKYSDVEQALRRY